MRIAQVAPLWESVPPKLYGGTERIVSYLTEELVRLGHDVTLFASGDSVTAARLEAICAHALRLNTGIFNRDAPMTMLMEQALGKTGEFDIIHSHLDFMGFPLARRNPTPTVTTFHGRLDLPELQPVFREYMEMPMVSISDAQRKPISWANWYATVYHGLPKDLYGLHQNSGTYLAFLGRIAPEKRPDHAIELAKRVGIPLRIAAKVDPMDQAYFHREIEPLLSDSRVSTCNECHLSGVDLSVFARETPCKTWACLVDQGLVNVASPEDSKILAWIERASPDSNLITPQVIAAEHDAFRDWIDANAALDAHETPSLRPASSVASMDFRPFCGSV